MELKFTIPLDPKSKKNSQKVIKIGGHYSITQGKIYKDYAKACAKYMPRLDKPITEPVNVKCVFYRETRRAVDLSNLEAAICDILALYGVIGDDCRDIVAGMDGSEVHWDKSHPRTEVTITSTERRYEQWAEKWKQGTTR